jgi:hypothetical protein
LIGARAQRWPPIQDHFFEWVKSCLELDDDGVVDGLGLNAKGWRPCGTVCAGWPEVVGSEEVCGTAEHNMAYYRAGGMDLAYDLLKVPAMSKFAPQALRSACSDLSSGRALLVSCGRCFCVAAPTVRQTFSPFVCCPEQWSSFAPALGFVGMGPSGALPSDIRSVLHPLCGYIG